MGQELQLFNRRASAASAHGCLDEHSAGVLVTDHIEIAATKKVAPGTKKLLAFRTPLRAAFQRIDGGNDVLDAGRGMAGAASRDFGVHQCLAHFKGMDKSAPFKIGQK
jgi:hypothetical protein